MGRSLPPGHGHANSRNRANRRHPTIGGCAGHPPEADDYWTRLGGILFASSVTADMVRRQVAAPASSPASASSSERAALSSSALSPKRLSMSCAARQMSISGIKWEAHEITIWPAHDAW